MRDWKLVYRRNNDHAVARTTDIVINVALHDRTIEWYTIEDCARR